jgi:hypothetical protein
MDNNNLLYQLYLQQIAEQNQKQNSLKGSLGKLNDYGNNLSTIGNALKDSVNNEVAQKLGASMSKFGNTMSNGATSANNLLNAPSNYFKGVAGQGLQNLGSSVASQGGALGTLGNGISSLGSTLSGTTAGATAGAATGEAVGGLTAAGTGAATGAATSGAAAGGAAAGSGAGAAATANPIGALVALGVMAATGTNRKAAKKQGQALLNSTMQQAQQANAESDQRLAQTQQIAQSMQNQDYTTPVLQNNSGYMTGGAANMQNSYPTTKEQFSQSLKDVGWDNNTINSALNGLNLGNKDMSDYINAYNEYAQDGQRIAIPQTEQEIANARALASGQAQQTGNVSATEQVKQGLLDKFINGISDFSKGYNENRNTAFSPENLKSDKFAETTTLPNETLVNYQNDLRNQGIDENVVNAVAEGKNSGNKDIANWISNNQAAYQPQTETTYTDKTKMGRLGEAVGTIGRMVNKPAVQALLAGGISTALTGNPLYGAGMAAKYGSNRALSNIYQDALAKQGIQTDTGMFGNLTSTDMDALMKPQYKEVEQENLKQYRKDLMDWHFKTLEETKRNNQVNNETKQINANANLIRANNSGKKSSGSGKAATKSKPQEKQGWNSDLAGFTRIISDPRFASKAGEARARFIQTYGVDPMKYVDK